MIAYCLVMNSATNEWEWYEFIRASRDNGRISIMGAHNLFYTAVQSIRDFVIVDRRDRPDAVAQIVEFAQTMASWHYVAHVDPADVFDQLRALGYTWNGMTPASTTSSGS